MSTYSGTDDITTNIKFITILPRGVNTSLGYTAIYGMCLTLTQSWSFCLEPGRMCCSTDTC